MTKKGYQIPDNPSPTDMGCMLVFYPNDPLYSQALIGSLTYLGVWNAWERDPTHKGILAARAWKEANEETLNNMTCLTDIATSLNAIASAISGLKTALRDALTVAQKADLVTKADPANPNTVENPPLTPEQMKDAVRKGTKEAHKEMADGAPPINIPPGDNPVVPNNPDQPTPEEKKNLTNVLNSFWSSIATLPIIEAFNTQEPEFNSGSAILSLPVAPLFNIGSIQIDFSEFEWLLDLLGSFLLGATGIRWMMWLFSGRGDG